MRIAELFDAVVHYDFVCIGSKIQYNIAHKSAFGRRKQRLLHPNGITLSAAII
jgi:hypothetical protein